MNLTTLLALQILDVHTGDNWTEVNIANTLKDISCAEALIVTPASPNSIAALLNHITFWNQVMVQRIEGVKVEIPESNGFDHPYLQTEIGWQELQKDNLKSANKLADAIQGFSSDKLLEPILPGYPSAYKNIQGISEHIHYHLGQMVFLKKFIKSNKS